jgi:hypothetical protein
MTKPHALSREKARAHAPLSPIHMASHVERNTIMLNL